MQALRPVLSCHEMAGFRAEGSWLRMKRGSRQTGAAQMCGRTELRSIKVVGLVRRKI